MMFGLLSKRERMPFVAWAALGAGLMYLLDPANGNRRRSLVRDKLLHLTRVSERGAVRAKRDLTNRVHGIAVRLQAKARPQEDVPDQVLAERLRSKMGMFVSHPHAVEVGVDSGVVKSARQRVLGKSGTEVPSTTTEPLAFSPPEPTPTEQAEQVARSIRE